MSGSSKDASGKKNFQNFDKSSFLALRVFFWQKSKKSSRTLKNKILKKYFYDIFYSYILTIWHPFYGGLIRAKFSPSLSHNVYIIQIYSFCPLAPSKMKILPKNFVNIIYSHNKMIWYHFWYGGPPPHHNSSKTCRPTRG